LLIVRPFVAVFGVASVMRCLVRATDPTSATSPTYPSHPADRPAIDPDRIVWLVEATASHLHLPTTCLIRSIVAAWLLARSGRAATLTIGVRTNAPNTLAAHAWVSHNGRALGPITSETYTSVSITTIDASATS
jgi:hypothetical protein